MMSLQEQLPSVFVSRLEDDVTPTGLSQHLERCSACFFRERPFVAVFVGGYDDPIDSNLREIRAAWINRYRVRFSIDCKGMAFVLPKRVQVGNLVATHFLAPPPYAFCVCATLNEALDWAKKQLPQRKTYEDTASGVPSTRRSMRATEPPRSLSRRARHLPPSAREEDSTSPKPLSSKDSIHPGRYSFGR